MPRTINAEHVETARRLLAYEAAAATDHAQQIAAAVHVYEKLFESLAPLVGEAGVNALFARSAQRNAAEFPALADVLVAGELARDVSAAGERLRSCLGELRPDVMTTAAASLYGAFLELLVSFIGEGLVRQVVRRAFPAIDPSIPEEERDP